MVRLHKRTILIVSIVIKFRYSSGSRHVSHLIRILLSKTAEPVSQKTTSIRPEEKSLRTFPRSLQPGARRKSEWLPEIISARIIHPNIELWWKHFAGRESWSPQRRLTIKTSTSTTRYSSEAGFHDLWSKSLSDHSYIFNSIMPPIQGRSLRMEADVSSCQSQQLSVVIWAVIRESQHANHTIMEIHTTRTISYDSQGIYTLRIRRKGNLFKPI